MAEKDRCCTHIKDDGARCEVTFGLSPAGLCYHHDPERAEERAEARARGAAATNRQKRAKARTSFDPDRLPRLDSLEAAQQWLETSGRLRAEGLLTHSDMSSYARIVSEWVKAEGARVTSQELRDTRKDLDEIQELREELARLKARIGPELRVSS